MRNSTEINRAMDKLERMIERLNEMRRYNQRTALLIIIIWWIGLPLAIWGSIYFGIIH